MFHNIFFVFTISDCFKNEKNTKEKWPHFNDSWNIYSRNFTNHHPFCKITRLSPRFVHRNRNWSFTTVGNFAEF